MNKHPEIKRVSVSKISLEYRDDMAFRIYFLMTRNHDAMKLWDEVPRAKKRERNCYGAGYILKIHKDIKKSKKVLKPIYALYDSAKDVYYTCGGTRVPSAYVLGLKKIPLYIYCTKCTKSYNIDGQHFQGMPEEFLERMRIRRQIHSGLPYLKYAIPELGFMGGEPPKKMEWLDILSLWSVSADSDQFLRRYNRIQSEH